MAADLGDCITQIIAIREDSGHQVTLFECLLPHLQKLALLKQIRVEFDDLLRKDGRVHISEFNKKILNIVASEPVPFLYERLGTKYNHILIDEFQDTSRLQFANLLPLIENALGCRAFQPGRWRWETGHLPISGGRYGSDCFPAPQGPGSV